MGWPIWKSVDQMLQGQKADGAILRPGQLNGNVLCWELNLAVDMDHLDKNRLKRLLLPEYVKRERVLEGWELLKIQEAASASVWRLVIAALQLGLREAKLIESHQEWLVQRGDGWWMVPSPERSKVKGVPKSVPLNGMAYEALFGKLGQDWWSILSPVGQREFFQAQLEENMRASWHS
jgi:hypothetical protein